MTGIAGLEFLDDIIKLISDRWLSGSGGVKPQISKVWNVKAVNVGTNREENIIVGLDGENPNIFSLQYSDGTNKVFDWLHDIAISIDIRTGLSEQRVLQMVDEVVRILKTSVAAPIINNRQYVQILPVNVTSMNEEYRNIFRYIVDAEAMRLNP